MKNLAYIIVLTLLLISCRNKSISETSIFTSEEMVDSNRIKKETTPLIAQTKTIEELWNVMVFEKGGCLGGQQHIKAKKKHIPTMVFSKTEWKEFAKKDKEELTHFLITKLADTITTNVHTCPFNNATIGEMAVYSLQHIHNKNWYDFSEFNEYRNREITGADDQPQIWLQKTLNNPSKRKKIASLFSSAQK